MGHYIVCLVTIDDMDKALKIARYLVHERIVASVSLVPEIRSIYRWKGDVHDEMERLLIMKTRHELFPTLERAVKELHPYETPQIVALDIAHGLPDYLAWIDDCTKAAE